MSNKRESPLMPAIRFVEEMGGWALAYLVQLISGVYILSNGWTRTWIGAVWQFVALSMLVYTVPKMRGWMRQLRKIRDDLRSQSPRDRR